MSGFKMLDSTQLDWSKGEGLLPAVIQDADTRQVLMLGYMNEEALAQTQQDGEVVFFSRTKGRLWKKGETSGNVLRVVALAADCDHDTILVTVHPAGPVCHTGTQSCFGDELDDPLLFLHTLSALIKARHDEGGEGSYTAKLFAAGTSRIAQKVGEEGVEISLAAMKNDREEIGNEAADLLYHLLVLLENADMGIADVCRILVERHKKA